MFEYICGDCWAELFPTEYFPDDIDYEKCDRCHNHALVCQHEVTDMCSVSCGCEGRVQNDFCEVPKWCPACAMNGRRDETADLAAMEEFRLALWAQHNRQSRVQRFIGSVKGLMN